jgi:hypothetical protein
MQHQAILKRAHLNPVVLNDCPREPRDINQETPEPKVQTCTTGAERMTYNHCIHAKVHSQEGTHCNWALQGRGATHTQLYRAVYASTGMYDGKLYAVSPHGPFRVQDELRRMS